MTARILVAEDDPKQAELIRLYLERDGHSVVLANDGRRAVETARELSPDLIVLDIMLPRMDGLDVARVLRQESAGPIIMVTARSDEDDKLLGLDLGADDYVTKPFSPRELAARVRALLRRSGIVTSQQSTFRLGALELDRTRHEVRRDGVAVDCTPKEFALLETLLAEPGRTFTRAQLIESAFGFDHFGLERTVDVHVKNLRRKLEQDPANPVYLVTVYGVGYKAAGASGAA
jgi:DNA-binding response OmpR family regulator